MYLEYWKLQRPPFDNTPNPDFLFRSRIHAEILQMLLYVVEAGKGAALVTGEVGSGKTLLSRTVARTLAGRDGYELALLTQPRLNVHQLFREILYQLTEETVPGDKQRILHRLHNHLFERHGAGRRVVLIIDEAQVITGAEVLDELRMLLNFQSDDRFLLTLLLLGQPELGDRLARFPQFMQRFAACCRLGNIAADEVGEYIRHRLALAGGGPDLFAPEALAAVARLSAGCPRKINTVCDLALLHGARNRLPRVAEETVVEAARRHYWA